MKFAALSLILLALSPVATAADVVVPVDSVENHVNVRMEADAKSEIVGKLSQGSSLPFHRTISGWHEVQLEDEAYGFVSEDWSLVITEDEFAARQEVAEVEAVAEVAEEAEIVEEVAAVEEAEIVEEVTDGEEVDVVEELAADVEEAETVEAVADVEEAEIVEAVADVEEAEIVEEVEETAEVEEADTEVAASQSVALVPVVTSQNAAAGAQGPPGPAGPPGPPGPRGPAGSGGSGASGNSSTVEGTEDFLVKFTDSTEGGNSQIFDDGRNVGIGTTEPQQRLEVNGNIQIHQKNSSVAGLMLTQSSGGMGYIMHNRADTLTLGSGSVDRMSIDGDGNVGIGTARPSHPLEMASGAYVSAGGVWTNSSSRERKDNIVSLTPEEALAALVALEPVRFNYKRDQSEEYVGFIAEDVPGLVASADRKSLSTMDIVAVLTRVVQEQQQKIAELEARLDENQ